AGRHLHAGSRDGDHRERAARVRRSDGERGADVPRRPDAVRRHEGVREHTRRAPLHRARDDRGAHGRDQALTKAPMQDGTPSLQALDRAFAVLELFGADQPEWGTSEVARAAGLPVPTAHRILTALAGRRYLARDERTRRFRLGPAALDLGDRARAMLDLRQAALPVLRRLARETDETALLTVPNGERDRSVCLERVESSQPLRLSVEPGRRLPLHAGASQKALLAFLGEEEIERIAAGSLEQLCRATITDSEALRSNLAEARERGW